MEPTVSAVRSNQPSSIVVRINLNSLHPYIMSWVELFKINAHHNVDVLFIFEIRWKTVMRRVGVKRSSPDSPSDHQENLPAVSVRASLTILHVDDIEVAL